MTMAQSSSRRVTKSQFWGFSSPLTKCIIQHSIWVPYKNGWTDRDAVWGDEWVWPEEQCVTWGDNPKGEGAILEETSLTTILIVNWTGPCSGVFTTGRCLIASVGRGGNCTPLAKSDAYDCLIGNWLLFSVAVFLLSVEQIWEWWVWLSTQYHAYIVPLYCSWVTLVYLSRELNNKNFPISYSEQLDLTTVLVLWTHFWQVYFLAHGFLMGVGWNSCQCPIVFKMHPLIGQFWKGDVLSNFLHRTKRVHGAMKIGNCCVSHQAVSSWWISVTRKVFVESYCVYNFVLIFFHIMGIILLYF